MPKVVFRILGVPENWKQHKTLTRGQAMALTARKKNWQSWVAVNGNRARLIKNVPECTESDPARQVHIMQDRHYELDTDSLPGTCEPIIDGLKRQLVRLIEKKRVYYPGARLLWDDKPRWLNKVSVSQRIVPRSEPQMITIIVEIPDAGPSDGNDSEVSDSSSN